MKKFWKQAAMAAAIFVATVSFGTAEAAERQGTPDYFGEFRVPLQLAADPMFQRMQLMQFAEYAAYHSPFNILPNDMLLMVQHEQPILAYFMAHGRLR